jgi:glutathione S-transferase
MSQSLTLISHALCPYVQRAVIALTEKGVVFERVYVDLANKPAWFEALSPIGKTPVLKVGSTAIFESAVILEYLEDTQPPALHPADPLRRAEHRALIEYASALLNDIWAFYSAPDATAFTAKRARLASRFEWLETRVGAPWVAGDRFSLVDAVFAPIFRYFDVFDTIESFGILAAKPNLARWRGTLAARPSVRHAVEADYNVRLWAFLCARHGHLARLMAARTKALGGQAKREKRVGGAL